MDKTLPTLDFTKNCQGELIFLQVIKNLKIFYFTCLTWRVLQKKKGYTTEIAVLLIYY